jgi:hypothetical protein
MTFSTHQNIGDISNILVRLPWLTTIAPQKRFSRFFAPYKKNSLSLLHYKLKMGLMNTFITQPTGYLPEGVSGNVSRRWSISMSCFTPPTFINK